jgi:hypothetical protein
MGQESSRHPVLGSRSPAGEKRLAGTQHDSAHVHFLNHQRISGCVFAPELPTPPIYRWSVVLNKDAVAPGLPMRPTSNPVRRGKELNRRAMVFDNQGCEPLEMVP